MLSAPVTREILDNVAVALANLPNEVRNAPITAKVTRHFNEQDQQLSEKMAALGWFREGSIWVSQADKDEILKQRKAVQDKLDAMSTEFDKSKERVSQLNRAIETNENAMHQIEATSYVRDSATNAFIQVPFPAVYYDLQRDNERQTKDRQAEQAHMDGLQKSAAELQKKLAPQKTLDVLRLIGPEGAPIRVATTPPPSTQPS